MADEKPETEAAPRVSVLSQYIRDLSFENVAVQKGTVLEETPDVTVQVALDANKRAEDVYEIVNKVKIESKLEDGPVFILELEYAGQFRVQNVADEQLHPFLLIECPRMIFPYLRRVIGDITRDGGYPPLNLDTIDYLALYRGEIERRKALAEKEAAGSA